MDILELIQAETHIPLRRVAAGEYASPCPFCRAGDDRFRVWPERGRYWCRVCNKCGDDIQFVRDYKDLGYRAACEYVNRGDNIIHHNHHNHHNNTIHHNNNNTKPLSPPGEQWLEQAWPFLIDCQERLWSDAGARAVAWLRGRGLADKTMTVAGLGYNDHDHNVDRQLWGVEPERDKNGKLHTMISLPRGIVIPSTIAGELWSMRIRRPVGKPKYHFVKGGTANGLFNADKIIAGQPVVLLEGEIDALTVCQAGFVGVATGSTCGARRTKWIARLSAASTVLVAYDNNNEGNKAAPYWLDALPNAKRWRPYWSDANQMLQDGADVGAWIAAGLG